MFVLEGIISGIQFTVLALFLGALTTAGFVLPRGEPAEIRRFLFFLSFVMLVAFLLIASASLFVQGAKLQGGRIPSLDILSRYLLRTQSGRIWIARQAYALVLTIAALWALRSERGVRKARVLVFFSLLLVASRSLTSHSIAVKENVSFVVSADAIHLLATALWAGGLPFLFLSLYGGLKRHGLPLAWAAETVLRFSWIALASVTVLVVTGLYQTWTHVQSSNVLFGSSYGKVLLLKVSVFLGMVSLGALNFLSTRPGLLRAAQSNGEVPLLERKALSRVGAESLLGLIVLCITGFLTVLPPGVHSLHLTTQSKERPLLSEERPRRSFLDRLASFVVPSLARLAPAEGAKVTILSPTPGESFKGDEIPIRYEFVKGKRGNHLHAYIDERLMGMFSHPESGMLTGISPGRHTLELRVVAEDHQTELDARDRVNLIVK